jgi:hypothetical protein
MIIILSGEAGSGKSTVIKKCGIYSDKIQIVEIYARQLPIAQHELVYGNDVLIKCVADNIYHINIPHFKYIDMVVEIVEMIYNGVSVLGDGRHSEMKQYYTTPRKVKDGILLKGELYVKA